MAIVTREAHEASLASLARAIPHPHEGILGPRSVAWRLGSDLAVRSDPKAPERHAFIEPARPLHILEYREALERTRPHWRQVWP